MIFFLSTSLFLLLIHTGSLLSQDEQTNFQSKEANRYMHQFDSLNSDNSEKTDSAIELKNQSIDSLIRVRKNCINNRIYLADTNASKNKNEVKTLAQNMEKETNSIQTQTQNRYTYQKQIADSCTNGETYRFRYQLQTLDTLINQYEYMQAHMDQYNDSILNATDSCIQNQYLKLDSMLQNQEGNCYQYRLELDSIICEGQKQLDSMFMKKQGEIDSLLGIKTQARFKITEKNAYSSEGDTIKNQYKRKLSEVIEEIIIIDTTDIRIKFCKILSEPQEIKTLFKLKLAESLKSALTDEIEIESVIWTEAKADVLKLISSTPVYNPEIIEIVYDGVVELTTDDKVILKSVTETANMANMSITNGFSIYPNPAADYIIISNANEIQSVAIYNLKGVMVIDYYNEINEINLSNLSSGIYLLKIIDNSGNIISRKIIKR